MEIKKPLTFDIFATKDNEMCINFSEPVTWIKFDYHEAVRIGNAILDCAKLIERDALPVQ